MDSAVVNENAEQEKAEEKEMEKEEKKDNKSGNAENSMPEQAPDENGDQAQDDQAQDGQAQDDQAQDDQAQDDQAQDDQAQDDQAQDDQAQDDQAQDAEQEPEEGGKMQKFDAFTAKATGKIRGWGDSAIDAGINYTRNIRDKYAGVRHKIGDTLRNAKDDVHYARKRAWKNIKTGASKVASAAKNSRFGKWVSKKLEERAAKKAAEAEMPKKPGFFSKVWTFTKTAASAIGKAVANTKLGKWISKKHEERAAKKAAEKEKKAQEPKKPGFLSRTFSSIKTGVIGLANKALNSRLGKIAMREYNTGKKWFNEKKEQLKAERDRRREEDEIHEHERRMEYESRKDPGYRKRYNDLVADLKQHPGIKDLKGSISRGDLDSIIDELEAGKEGGSEKKSTAADKAEKAGKWVSRGNVIGTVLPKLTDKVSKNTGTAVSNGFKAAGNTIKMGTNIARTVQSARQKNALKKIAESDEIKNNEVLSRVTELSADQAHKDAVDSGFNATGNLVDVTSNVVGAVPGLKTASKLVSGIGGTAVKGVKAIVDSSMEAKTEKMSIKGILGGVNGYRALKEKHRLKAREMRAAMREALGVQTNADILNADRANLAIKTANMMKSGNAGANSLGNTMKAHSSGEVFRGMGGKNERVKLSTQARA